MNNYHLKGTILRLSPDTHVAAIQHDAITADDGKVWMEAMTMEFPVRPKEEFAKLRAGQKITATVHQRESDSDYWIDQIQIQP